MYPTDSTLPQSPGPAQPAAPDPAAPPAPPAEPTAATTSPTSPTSSKQPEPGDVVDIRFDNGRGTVVEQKAIVIAKVDVPDVTDGQQQDSTHVEYDVAPVTTMRVGADHLVDDEG